MYLDTQPHTDEEYPNVYKKWLETRLNCAVLSATREPATSGFIDAVVTQGGCRYQTAGALRDELWVRNKHPRSDFFGHNFVKFKYPSEVNEILDFRFSMDPLNKPSGETISGSYRPVYSLTLHEMATIPNWGLPTVAPEHYPCGQDVPLKPMDHSPLCCKKESCLTRFCKDPTPIPSVAYSRDCGSKLRGA